MRILDRYLFLSIVRVFISTILLFTFLYILIDAASHLDDFISNKVPSLTILNYYASFFPVIFVQTSPIACLLAVLFTYSSLNNNNEIIALRASGLNYWKITGPAIIFGLIVTSMVFMVNERFAPGAAILAQEIKKDKIETKVSGRQEQAQPIKNLFFYGMNNRLFYIDAYDPAAKTLAGVMIFVQDDQQRVIEKVTAFKASWTGTNWKFINGQISHYNLEDQSLKDDLEVFKEKIIEIHESPADLLKQGLNNTAMNIMQLKTYIKRFKASGAVVALNNLKVDLHQKIAYPFACIIIIFVGMPFILVTGKRKGLTFASIGIALAISFLFYVVNAVGLALGKGGVLPPFLAAWLAPILFSGAGFYLIRKLF